MVTTTASIYGNEETNKVLFQINGWKTALGIIKDFYGLRDDELKNSKRLKELNVRWLPRIWELGCTKEQFDTLFGDVIDYGNTKWTTGESNNSSVTWTEWEWELETPKKRIRKSA